MEKKAHLIRNNVFVTWTLWPTFVCFKLCVCPCLFVWVYLGSTVTVASSITEGIGERVSVAERGCECKVSKHLSIQAVQEVQ